ncbi:Elongator complex protein 4 [Chytriomyces sp. MP71]|nr:Elongator complex protein 4 [Chytriomyces sp. MP71]
MSTFRRRLPAASGSLPTTSSASAVGIAGEGGASVGQAHSQSHSHSQIRGTRISGVSGRPVASFGIASLDASIGDCPLGSLTLLLTDRASAYAALIARYFAAQGIASNNVVCVAAASPLSQQTSIHEANTSNLPNAPEAFVRSLMLKIEDVDSDTIPATEDPEDDEAPAPSTTRTLGSLRDTSSTADRLSIAWRYQGMPKWNASSTPHTAASSAGGGPFCCKFDITKTLPATTLDASSIALVNIDTWSHLASAQLYANLLDSIRTILDQGKFWTSTHAVAPNLLRIILDDVGGPTWGRDAGSEASMQNLFKFLTCLRAMLRNARAVAMVTIAAHVFKGHHTGIATNPHVRLLQHACDLVLEVESFSGSKRIFSEHFTTEFHGFLHVHKMPHVHTLAPGGGASRLGATDLHSLAFKARRKRFLVEPFRLPPEKDEVAEASAAAASGVEGKEGEGRRASRGVAVGGPGCGSGGGSSKLDF